ncbi:MAG TPA: hypothetical protein VFJ97_06305 [Dermatophilaceae bacterium]|nr:hypothetical protein [Dermatophilaceae bacterium]
MSRPWDADPSAEFTRRLGEDPMELGVTTTTPDCPALWELSNGDIAVIGRDLTTAYHGRLPDGVSVGADERLVILPGVVLRSAKPDIGEA